MTSALLHGGTSTVYAIGAPPAASHWQVRVHCPNTQRGDSPLSRWKRGRGPGEEALKNARITGESQSLATVPLKNESLSVSAVWCLFEAGKTVWSCLLPAHRPGGLDAVMAAVVLPHRPRTRRAVHRAVGPWTGGFGTAGRPSPRPKGDGRVCRWGRDGLSRPGNPPGRRSKCPLKMGVLAISLGLPCWEDRDYMQDDYGGGHWTRRLSLSLWLVIINAVVFAAQFLRPFWLAATSSNDGSVLLESYFALWPEKLVHGYVWQLLTFQFLHAWRVPPAHQLRHALHLRPDGGDGPGWRNSPALYLLSGTFGGLLQIGLSYAFPNHFGFGPVLGASAGVFGLIAAFATLYANQPITMLLAFILPVTMPAKYLLLVEAILALLGLFDAKRHRPRRAPGRHHHGRALRAKDHALARLRRSVRGARPRANSSAPAPQGSAAGSACPQRPTIPRPKPISSAGSGPHPQKILPPTASTASRKRNARPSKPPARRCRAVNPSRALQAGRELRTSLRYRTGLSFNRFAINCAPNESIIEPLLDWYRQSLKVGVSPSWRC